VQDPRHFLVDQLHRVLAEHPLPMDLAPQKRIVLEIL